ncbi:MAG: NosD domain-containing protein [Candidatus Hodarchaeales archaeon]|jgi:parallel beta-helix repeat protein
MKKARKNEFKLMIVGVLIGVLILSNIDFNLDHSSNSIKPTTLSDNLTRNKVLASVISINGNSDFTTCGCVAPGGDGTVNNPYVIANMTIQGSGGPGISITNTNVYFIIQNVTVTGSTTPGVGALDLQNVTNGYLTNNTATNSYYGFRLISDSNYNVLINNNATGNSGFGFYLAFSSNNTLNNNTAVENSYGFHFYSSNNNTLSNNTVTGNGGYGFHLSSSSNNNVLNNNTATGNSLDGFRLFSSSNNNVLNNNTATGNTQHGFYLEQSNSNTLNNNTATGNNEQGFFLDDSDGNTLSNNTATGNNEQGFFLGVSIGNTLNNNTATGNTLNGFLLSVSNTNNVLSNNIATSNGYYGFILSSSTSTNNVLNNNTATGNSLDGFYLLGSSSNTLNNNIATSNTGHGFYLEQSNSNTLNNNIATGNSQNGFYLQSASNNIFKLNFAGGNQIGLFLASIKPPYTSTQNFVFFNRFLENTVHEVHDNSSGNSEWYGNMYGDNLGPSGTQYLIPGTAEANDLNPIVLDSDQDAIPDWYEILFGLNRFFDDSKLDPDNDGLSNLQEYLLGINPFVSDMISSPDIVISTITDNETIYWTATSSNATSYVVYLNGTNNQSGTWISGQEINVSLIGLSAGAHNFTLVVTDDYGHTVLDTVIVTIPDTSELLTFMLRVYREFFSLENITYTFLITDQYKNPIDGALVDVEFFGENYTASPLGSGLYEVVLPYTPTEENIIVTITRVDIGESVFQYYVYVDPPALNNKPLIEEFGSILLGAILVGLILSVGMGIFIKKRK